MDSCDRFYDDSLLFNEVFMTLLCKMVPKSPNYSNCRAGYALGTAALLLLAPVSRWTGDWWPLFPVDLTALWWTLAAAKWRVSAQLAAWWWQALITPWLATYTPAWAGGGVGDSKKIFWTYCLIQQIFLLSHLHLISISKYLIKYLHNFPLCGCGYIFLSLLGGWARVRGITKHCWCGHADTWHVADHGDLSSSWCGDYAAAARGPTQPRAARRLS